MSLPPESMRTISRQIAHFQLDDREPNPSFAGSENPTGSADVALLMADKQQQGGLATTAGDG
jgi:hypothetical protein